MPESAKEGATGLPEGSDIGLGPGDRAFEPHYSDQGSLRSVDLREPFWITGGIAQMTRVLKCCRRAVSRARTGLLLRGTGGRRCGGEGWGL